MTMQVVKVEAEVEKEEVEIWMRVEAERGKR